MEALRKIISVKDSLPQLNLPESLRNRNVEIIILPSLEEPQQEHIGKRILGSMKGLITTPDDFDEPLILG